jgi:N-acetylglucosaminyldiphosphoundecaprenol N-acetyl-beta-D-mannosaminyltransferase
MVAADGMPLVWLSRRRAPTGAEIERVYGPDLMLAAFARSESAGWRHFLYGSTPETLVCLEANLHERFPRARVVGSYSPPFRSLDAGEEAAVEAEIAAARPDIVWVGLSTPKQERWMADHVARLHVPVLVGVGAAFDFHAGLKRQAPRWAQRAGLEWLFRLATEPRRLAGRYLRNNPRFVWMLVRQAVRDRAAQRARPTRRVRAPARPTPPSAGGAGNRPRRRGT